MTAKGFLESLLSVEQQDAAVFSARLQDYGGAAFGGDVLAKAALAASRTCRDKMLHSLHVAFLRPLTPGASVELRVATLSEGRRVARRRIDVSLADRLLCQVTASFSVESPGEAWQEAVAPKVPRPESLTPDVEVARRDGWEGWDPEQEEFEWGILDPVDRQSLLPGMGSAWCVWLRPRQPLPTDPALHAAATAYVSDLLSHRSACRRLGRDFGPDSFASLDHSVQIHRPGAWDAWWLLCDRSEVARAGRAFWQRRIFAGDGTLVASAAQDAWMQ